MTKYIFVTGGVVSSLGKGIVSASVGRILKNKNIDVSIMKLDPYLNVDPGTMSPFQHGEVFVTSDGSETDLDLGHYERFINEELNKKKTKKLTLKISPYIKKLILTNFQKEIDNIESSRKVKIILCVRRIFSFIYICFIWFFKYYIVIMWNDYNRHYLR